MEQTNFERLEIYRRSEQLADAVWRITGDWPPFARQTMGAQIVRATDSIGANIAEGSGRASRQDFRRHLRIARGSLYETRHWLRRSVQRALLTPDHVAELQPLVDDMTRMLNAYISAVSRSIRHLGS